MVPLQEEFAVELQNFEELARFLNPSPGAIPDLKGVDIHGLSLPALRRALTQIAEVNGVISARRR